MGQWNREAFRAWLEVQMAETHTRARGMADSSKEIPGLALDRIGLEPANPAQTEASGRRPGRWT